MYLAAIMFLLLVGGILRDYSGSSLLTPARMIMSAQTYNQVFTLHGAIMIFLFIIPSIPAALGNFVLPLMMGAKDVAFPRLNLASWYIYMVGAVLAISIFTGGVDTGWTFYTPYSTTTTTSVMSMTLGVFILGFSSIFTGLNFIVTIHKLRAPGMTWFKMPLMVWGLYATAIIQVLATPVLGITLVLLILERVFGIGIFRSGHGWRPGTVPAFLLVLFASGGLYHDFPGMAIISETDRRIFRTRRFSATRPIAFSSLWGSRSSVFWSGDITCSPAASRRLAAMMFSFLTFLVGDTIGYQGIQLAGDDV